MTATRARIGSRWQGAILPAAAVMVGGLLLAGCVTSEHAQRAPVAATDGLELNGRLAGRAVSVSDGEPEVLLSDCDPADGRDVDLCIISFTIDGAPVGVVIENPAALVEDTRLDVRSPARAGCEAHCDDVEDVAIVEVRRGDEAQFARGGGLEVRAAGERYAAAFTLDFEDGSVSGAFNVRPMRLADPTPDP